MSLNLNIRTGLAAAVFSIAAMALLPGVAQASYQTRCAPCHDPGPGTVANEVNNLPNGIKFSGSIRAANNRAYLDALLAAGMTSVPLVERDAIAEEIRASSSAVAASITSAPPPGGVVGIAYGFTVTTSGPPSLALGSTTSLITYDPLPSSFYLTAAAPRHAHRRHSVY